MAIVLTHAHLDHCGPAHDAVYEITACGDEGTIAFHEVGKVFFPASKLPVDLLRI